MIQGFFKLRDQGDMIVATAGSKLQLQDAMFEDFAVSTLLSSSDSTVDIYNVTFRNVSSVNPVLKVPVNSQIKIRTMILSNMKNSFASMANSIVDGEDISITDHTCNSDIPVLLNTQMGNVQVSNIRIKDISKINDIKNGCTIFQFQDSLGKTKLSQINAKNVEGRIINSIFSDIEVTDSYFQDLSSIRYGGLAISAEASSIKVTNSTFTQC